MGRNTRKPMLSQFQVLKVFPRRSYLYLLWLAEPAAFTCSRCSLGETSTLVAFTKYKWDEPVCSGCYGYLLAASKTTDCVRDTQDGLIGVNASIHSRRQPNIRKSRTSAHRDRKFNERLELNNKSDRNNKDRQKKVLGFLPQFNNAKWTYNCIGFASSKYKLPQALFASRSYTWQQYSKETSRKAKRSNNLNRPSSISWAISYSL
jgi:hypothetical protein